MYVYLQSLAYPSAHPKVSTLTNCISTCICTYNPWRTLQRTHKSPPAPTVSLHVSVLTILGVPFSAPTSLHPHQLYLYMYVYLQSLVYPSAHPQVSTLTNCISTCICTYNPWRTPRRTHKSPPAPTVSLWTLWLLHCFQPPTGIP